MDWAHLIKELIDQAGLTQGRIAEACGVAQSTVSEVARGVIKRPAFDFGTKLIALHKAEVLDKRADSATLGQAA
jgi:predicted XRE-type DNA-binding protein